MNFMDIFKKYKTITNMMDRGAHIDLGSTHIRHYAHRLRHKSKTLRAFAYYPLERSTPAGTFMLFRDAAYQVVSGTFLRCHISARGREEPLIHPRIDFSKKEAKKK